MKEKASVLQGLFLLSPLKMGSVRRREFNMLQYFALSG